MPRIATFALFLAVLLVPVPANRANAGEPFLGAAYPVDVEISRTAGLFQWVDSLAETTVGKTVPAHWADYRRRWGKPSADDVKLLAQFGKARLAHALATRDRSAMLGIFCEASSVEAAIAAASKDLTAQDAADLAAALSGLSPKFDQVWNGGAVPRAFVKRVAKDQRRGELASFLAKVAAFYGVDPAKMPRPRLVLVPVPDGWGTHAQAVGRSLLLEIRPNDDLAQEAAVIVHENCHFLFDAMPVERRDRLEDFARTQPYGEAAWQIMGEALPTAFGQGIADRALRPSAWSRRSPWYHLPDVDAYAKALHAAANHAFATGAKFDDSFIRHATAVYAQQARHERPQVAGMDDAPPPAKPPATAPATPQ